MKFTSQSIFIPLLVAAVPLQIVHGWSTCRVPLAYGNGLMGPMVMSPWSLMRQQQAMVDRAFTRSSPSFQVTDDNEKFQVAVDVPGVKMEDIDVNIEDDGQILTISAKRESTKDRMTYTSQFSQSFSLDPSVDVDKFTANLQNGVLVVAAPKDLKRIEEKIRRIPVTVSGTAAVEKPESTGEDSEVHHEDNKNAAKDHNEESMAV